MKFGMGAKRPKQAPTAVERAAHKLRMLLAGAIESFEPVTLGTPDIRNQFSTESCFGFAVCQAIHLRRQALGLSSSLPSPMVPYFEARRLETSRDSEVTDSGSDPYGMITALADFGACPWDVDPFDAARINERPGAIAMQTAQRTQCTLQPILESGGALWTAIQHAISVERLPVLIALEVTDEFRHPTNGVVDRTSGDSQGLHANCLFANHDGGVVTANSWGRETWAGSSNGTALLTERFVRERVVWAGSLELEEAA